MGEKGQKDKKKPAVEVKQAATPLQLSGKISKNQRATREKQVAKEWYCRKGHKMRVIKIAYVKGPDKIELVCGCDPGFGENDGRITVTGGDQWKQRKAKISTSQARVWWEYPSKEVS